MISDWFKPRKPKPLTEAELKERAEMVEWSNEASAFSAMTLCPGWKLFMKALEVREQGWMDKLIESRGCSVEAIQARVQEIRAIKQAVDDAIQLGESAQKKLEEKLRE